MITCPQCSFANQDHYKCCLSCSANLKPTGFLQLFVSHAWADKVRPQFGRLTAELEGYDLWIDKTGIAPGGQIRGRVADGIDKADVVLVLWSKAAAESREVEFELETATAKGKDIIPCRIDDTSVDECPALRGRLYVNLQEESPEVGWMRLKYALSERFISKTRSELASMRPGPERDERATTLAALTKAQQKVRGRLALLEDTEYRIKAGAGDRNKRNPYMLNMLRNLATTMGADTSPHAGGVKELMEFTQTVFERLPDDDAATLQFRTTLLRNKLLELNSAGENPWLTQFGALLDQMTALRGGI